MEESWITLSTEQIAELGEYERTPGWRVLSRDALLSVFPARLRSKIDSALAITAETTTGGTYLVFSALRVDSKDRALDMEPFGLIVHSTGPGSTGVFLHHGEWEGRTEPAPPDFWYEVHAYGIGDYFFARPPGSRTSGSLDELPTKHDGAFRTVIRAIRDRVDRRKRGTA